MRTGAVTGWACLFAFAAAWGVACTPTGGSTTTTTSGANPGDTTSGDGGAYNGPNGETDVGCGGPVSPKCESGKRCKADADCTTNACSYQGVCIDVPSCKVHLGGDTCGTGEVGSDGAQHESCCKSLPVPGFTDPTHPGKTVYLDKYEITAGRVRAWINSIAAANGGKPDIRGWATKNPPTIWDPSWNKYLPVDWDGEDRVHVQNIFLGDRRGQPDEPPVPPNDADVKTGVNWQFNGAMFLYVHGINCATQESSYAFPTFWYPPDVMSLYGSSYPPRPDGIDFGGQTIKAQDSLDVKSMNCITNVMLQAFCAWDGGQLATSEVLDYVTASPPDLGDMPGCGTQIGTEYPPTTPKSMTGGRCPDLAKINATFDAGGQLPKPNSPLNVNNYVYPQFADGTTSDKTWEISAPGRGSKAEGGDQVDQIVVNPGDEPWVDLAGNLSETVLTTKNGAFLSRFGLKYRGIGYQSARSELNTRNDWPGEGGQRRYERPERKAAWAGGRCMRFK